MQANIKAFSRYLQKKGQVAEKSGIFSMSKI